MNSQFLLPDVPYKPTLHPPISGQCNSINVTWSPPIPGALGDPVIGYVAQIAGADPKEEWINCSLRGTLRSRTCLFTHLEKDTTYRVRVFAKNKLGYSLPSIAKEISTKQAGTISLACQNFIKVFFFFNTIHQNYRAMIA